MSCVMSLFEPNRRWWGGRVPFAFDISFDGGKNQAVKQTINNAIAAWNAKGLAVRWEPQASEPDFVLFSVNPVPGWPGWVSVSQSSASQHRGMAGGPQLIWVSTAATQASLLHEMGHAVGLAHEQNRADRNSHIEMLWANIDPRQVNQYFPDPLMTDDVGAYDLLSLMHYGPNAYSGNGQPAFRVRDPSAPPPGNASDLSAGDIDGIQFLYDDSTFVTVPVPAFSAFIYPAQVEVPRFFADVPPFQATPPRLRVSPPRVRVGRQSYDVPSFDAQPPGFTVTPPRLEVAPPPAPIQHEPVVVTPPPMRVKKSKGKKVRRVTLCPEPITIDPPAVTADPPPLLVTPPRMAVTPPSFNVTPPSFRVGPIEVRPPEMTVNPPEMIVDPPSFSVHPPKVTFDPPPVSVVPPPFEALV